MKQVLSLRIKSNRLWHWQIGIDSLICENATN